MKRNFLSVCLIALCAFTSRAQVEEKPLDAFIRHVGESHTFKTVGGIWQPDRLFDQKELLQAVEKAQPLTINFSKIATFMQQKATAIDLVIPNMDGGSYTLELARYDNFSNDFQVHANGANGDTKVDYTPGLYYSGIVKGIPGSLVAFSFFNNEVYGVFSIPGEGNYVLVPNTMTGAGPGNVNYILYNDNDIINKENAPKCGVDELPALELPARKTTTTANNDVYNNCTQVRCYELVDYSMYTKKGANVTTVTNYLTALFNVKATIYRNESIQIVLKYVAINTSTDTYASMPALSSDINKWLDTFGKRTQNTLYGCDVANLFTTRVTNVNDQMGGVAWLNGMCQPYYAPQFFGPYAICHLYNTTSTSVSAFPSYSWEIEVSTHELGHNLGSPHTHKCCWGPARNYAIDSCYTLEGSCIAPAGRPSSSVGGTIMSYCHLVSSGINFSNGFGLQPGDTVRHFINQEFSSTCGVVYHPGVAPVTANRTISANRECTDMSTGYTYYWYDKNTASTADDTLVLMVKKNGNNIGNLNTTGFSVKQSTLTGWGGGTGVATTFPAGTIGAAATNTAMNRYWSVVAKGRPTTAVEVVYPFTVKDSADIDGSVTGTVPVTSLKMYRTDSAIAPNPSAGFTGATAANIHAYTYGAAASTSQWSLTRSGDTCFAHFMTTNLSGGGTSYYPSGLITSVNNAGGVIGVNIYPNPAYDKWFVSVAGTVDEDMDMQLYSADGKVVMTQKVATGVINTISAETLPVGMYFYRIVAKEGIATGNLMKK